MVGLLIDKVLFEHVDLVVPQHHPLSNLAQGFYLSRKPLVFVDFFHESSVLLGLSGINGLGPAAFFVEHSLFSCADPSSVHLVLGHVRNVVQFDEVGVPQDIVFDFKVVLGSWVESRADGRCVLEQRRSSEFPPGTGVLVKLSHEFL
jgi:hypothetical protein